MAESEIGAVINRLAESLVMVEPEDMPLLGKVHADLVEFGGCGESMGVQAFQQFATAAADTVEKIIFREHDTPEEALAMIAEFISDLQTKHHQSGGGGVKNPWRLRPQGLRRPRMNRPAYMLNRWETPMGWLIPMLLRLQTVSPLSRTLTCSVNSSVRHANTWSRSMQNS